MQNLEKDANFFTENCRKLQKIVIRTSTPGRGVFFQRAVCELLLGTSKRLGRFRARETLFCLP
jgi:hypothetical protein